MSWIYRIFKRTPKEPDYETILSTLALDIQKRQHSLSEIRLRERRSTLLVTLYALAAYVVYVGVWYQVMLPFGGAWNPKVERAVKSIPVIIGPIIILFTRRIVQIWYERIGNKEEKSLRKLLQEQRVKVEEIKKKTNFYETQNLLSRYDSPTGTPQRQPPQQPAQVLRQRPQGPPATPLQQKQHSRSLPPQTPVSAPAQLSPIPPQKKQWFDKLADALLGDETPGTSPVVQAKLRQLEQLKSEERYALICEKCLAHNGLVKESAYGAMKYICPKCGHLNGQPGAIPSPSPITSHIISSSIAKSSPLNSPSTSAESRVEEKSDRSLEDMDTS